MNLSCKATPQQLKEHQVIIKTNMTSTNPEGVLKRIIHDADPDGCLGNYLYRLGDSFYYDNPSKGCEIALPEVVSEAVGHGNSFVSYDFSSIKEEHLVIIDQDVTQDVFWQLLENPSIKTIEIYDHHLCTGLLEIPGDCQKNIFIMHPSKEKNICSAMLVYYRFFAAADLYKETYPPRLSRFMHDNERFERIGEITALVNAYDTWDYTYHNEFSSKALVSSIFEQGLDEFKNASFWDTLSVYFKDFCIEAEQKYTETKNRCKVVIQKYMIRGLLNLEFFGGNGTAKMGVIFHSDNMDLVAEAGFQHDPEIEIMVLVYVKPSKDRRTIKLSIRGTGAIDTTMITKWGGGGGHRNASGMQISLHRFQIFLDQFEQVASFS